MKIKNILLIITAITIVSCNDARKSETFRVLEDVDSYIEARPDSALAVLEGIDVEDLGSREEKAKYALLMSMALDKNYIDRTDFEVLQPAIDYYEDHGTATDKLRTFYYQGRIYQNGGDDEMAMECFVRAVEEGDGAEDCMTMARCLFSQGTLYQALYNWERVIETNIAAAAFFQFGGNINSQLRSLSRALIGYSQTKDLEGAGKCFNVCEDLLDQASLSNKSFYYAAKLSYYFEHYDSKQLEDVLNEYLNCVPAAHWDWQSIAYAYTILGEFENASDALSNYRGDKNARYYAITSAIHKDRREFQKAIEAYEKYIHLSDSLDLVIFEQDTKFVEERHNLEVQAYKEREAKNNRTIIILICIIVLFVALIAIYLIRKQLQIRTAEKKQLEIEKKRYEQLYADAIAERDALTKMIEDSSVKDETKTVIRERLEVLNKVIISHITDTSSANKKAFQELEALVADRDSFIESTRLTIEGNNPEFIAALKKQGLTDEEINICCLYVIGLKGKDIKAYTSQPRHYNQSADIRHKLGLTENDTNLSIFLREMLEK
jgi:tetratricopeptide (TPR) repeat protein